MRSLRGRVLLTVSVTTALILLTFGIALYVSLRAALLKNFDHDLLSKAKVIASLTEFHDERFSLDADDLQMPEFLTPAKPNRAEYYELWLAPDKRIARSPTLGDMDLLPAAPKASQSFSYTTLPDGAAGRLVVFSFKTVSQEEDENRPSTAPARYAVIAIARPTREMDEVLSEAFTLLCVLGTAAVVLACAILWLSTRRALRPLERIARQIAELRPEALVPRFADSGVPAELDPVISKLSDLLARLAEAFERERAFSADVAHELRTPLAGLITTLEVTRSRPREPAVYEAAIAKCLLVANRMNQLVENLLLLARADSNQLAVKTVETDLVELLEDAVAPYRQRLAEKNVRIDWQVISPLVVCSDPAHFNLILQNLFDNAATYINAGGTLSVSARSEGRQVLLTIANTGSAVPAHSVSWLTQRFWRGDTARTDTGVHCGLGLAIVSRIASILHLEVGCESEAGREFRVTLTLPAP